MSLEGSRERQNDHLSQPFMGGTDSQIAYWLSKEGIEGVAMGEISLCGFQQKSTTLDSIVCLYRHLIT